MDAAVAATAHPSADSEKLSVDAEQDSHTGDGHHEGFKMQLSESCMEYMIFLVDQHLEAREALSALELVRKAAAQLADDLTRNYIWQRDTFRLSLKVENGLMYLHGATQFGDCLEDEWLIVYILRELSKSRPSLWIRVFDDDGEFLLVEAAQMLPKWLNPENDRNRPWIHNGQLLIIYLEAERNDAAARAIDLREALHVIRTDPSQLLHSPMIEAEAFYRLEKYPGQIANSLHHAEVIIPRKLAYIIHARPKAIAPATEAFYLRDPRSLNQLLRPPPSLVFPPTDLVTVSICFTKVLYAQLKSQRFQPPPAWKTLVDQAEVEVAKGSEMASKKLERLVLGMKVTSGFEMMVAKRDVNNSQVTREVAFLLDDLDEDGVTSLPTDKEIEAWEDNNREDDDSWMDINFEDLDRALDGERGTGGGFGDPVAHTDLQKLVSRFEAFLNEDSTGVAGVDFNQMDEDDDDDDLTDDGSEVEDKEVSFDEEQFASMMREMMGLPPEESTSYQHGSGPAEDQKIGTTRSTEEKEEDEQIRALMAQMESELHEHGALALDPPPAKLASLKGTSGLGRGRQQDGAALASDEDDNHDKCSEMSDVDIDYNLAKNLLESFKGQGGLPGPAGNMLALLGLRLPRDEDDTEAPKQ